MNLKKFVGPLIPLTAQMVKQLPANPDRVQPCVSDPLEKGIQPTPVLFPENSILRSSVGYRQHMDRQRVRHD